MGQTEGLAMRCLPRAFGTVTAVSVAALLGFATPSHAAWIYTRSGPNGDVRFFEVYAGDTIDVEVVVNTAGSVTTGYSLDVIWDAGLRQLLTVSNPAVDIVEFDPEGIPHLDYAGPC